MLTKEQAEKAVTKAEVELGAARKRLDAEKTKLGEREAAHAVALKREQAIRADVQKELIAQADGDAGAAKRVEKLKVERKAIKDVVEDEAHVVLHLRTRVAGLEAAAGKAQRGVVRALWDVISAKRVEVAARVDTALAAVVAESNALVELVMQADAIANALHVHAGKSPFQILRRELLYAVLSSLGRIPAVADQMQDRATASTRVGEGGLAGTERERVSNEGFSKLLDAAVVELGPALPTPSPWARIPDEDVISDLAEVAS